MSRPWEQCARTGGWDAWAVQADDGGGQWHRGTPYLVDVGHHVGGRAPVRTELGRQGLPLLGEHTHVWGVHQHWHDAQALLLQRVEHHQEPVGWGHTGMATPAPRRHGCPMPHNTHGSRAPTHCFTESQVPPSPPHHGPTSPESKAGSPYRGEVSSLTTVLSGRESWLGRTSSWGEKGAVRAGVRPPPLPAGPRDTGTGWGSVPEPPPSTEPAGRAVLPGGMGHLGHGEPQTEVLLTVLRKGAAGSWR